MEDKKAVEPVILDVREVSNVTDYYVIVHGNSTPHIKALAEEVQVRLKKEDGVRTHRTSGTADSAWIAMDYVDVVLHIFSRETREYYALEELWSDAKPVPVGAGG